jgi:hypothetical protein
MGTDCVRKYDPDFWVKVVNQKIEELGDADVVITDVRFPNEAAAIVAKNGFLVRVNRKRKGADDQHASETSLDDWEPWHIVLENDGKLADLKSFATELPNLLAFRYFGMVQ